MVEPSTAKRSQAYIDLYLALRDGGVEEGEAARLAYLLNGDERDFNERHDNLMREQA